MILFNLHAYLSLLLLLGDTGVSGAGVGVGAPQDPPVELEWGVGEGYNPPGGEWYAGSLLEYSCGKVWIGILENS